MVLINCNIDVDSKLNFVEQRVWLAVVGILSVAMGESLKSDVPKLKLITFAVPNEI